MTIIRPKVSSLVASQLPEFIRDDYQTFVNFLKAYYDFLETTQKDPITLRDIDTTLDAFITHFKSELTHNIPYSTVATDVYGAYSAIDERFLITRVKDFYLAKGSEASFKLLFRILFNKDIELQYPSTQMLRASDGKWNQDVSVFVNILVGNPQDIVGKLIDVVTQTKIIKVVVDRSQYVEVKVDSVIRISDTIYEFILDRRFFGNISIGDQLRYYDNITNTLKFNGIILPTTSNLKVEQAGTGFKVGEIYNISNYQGYGTIMKISTVNLVGGIQQAQFIKYGTGYTTDFTASVLSKIGQDTAASDGVIISGVGSSHGISEKLKGFSERGSLNFSDYNLARVFTLTGTISATNNSSTITGVDTLFSTELVINDFITLNNVQYKIQSVNSNTNITLLINYVGGSSTSLTSVIATNPATLDGTYAGLTIREFGISSFDSVSTSNIPAIIKVSIGPLARYPGYYINNDGFLNDAIYVQDSKFYQAFSYVIKIDQSLETYKTIVKNLIHPAGMAVFGEYDLRNEFTVNTAVETLIRILSLNVKDFAVLTDTSLYNGLALIARKDIIKSITTGVLNNDSSVDDQTVTLSDTVGSALTRTIPFFNQTKLIDGSSLNFNGSVDSALVTSSDDTPIKTITKIFNLDTMFPTESISTIDTTKLLNDSTVLNEIAYSYADISTRLGINSIVTNKSLLDTQIISDTDAISAFDLNRTTPAISFVKTPITEVYSGAIDTGGNIVFNPYAEAGFFLNDGGVYIGQPITF